MMKGSVCIDAVYGQKMPFTEAMREVSALGFDGIEFWNWEDKDIRAIANCSEELQLPVVAFCTRMLDPELPYLREDYLNGVRESIQVADTLHCRQLITQVGYDHTDPAIGKVERRKHLIEMMKRVGEMGYQGYVGLEYMIDDLPENGLKKARDMI